jgi:C1A family cysteine protease
MLPLLIARRPRYGWIPDLPDQRDFLYSKLFVEKPFINPPQASLQEKCTPVEDQGELGSCTACALVGNLEFLKKAQTKSVINFSKMFLYYNERVIRHAVKTDSGASLRDGIKTLVKVGDSLEKFWPYDISLFTKKPSQKAYENALNYQITSYYSIKSLNEMKHTLASGFPFVFGVAVYESFETEKVTKSGNVPLPKKDERLLGGHAILAVGYDDKKEIFIFRNSWGESWGDKGYGQLPYAYLSNSHLSSDFWTVRGME